MAQPLQGDENDAVQRKQIAGWFEGRQARPAR